MSKIKKGTEKRMGKKGFFFFWFSVSLDALHWWCRILYKYEYQLKFRYLI